MLQGHRALPFRWILPSTQLVLCVVVLWPLRSSLIHEVRESVRASRSMKSSPPETAENQQFIILISKPLTQQERHEIEIFERRKWAPMLLNLPSGLVQLPYVILNPAKQEWVPKQFDLMTWRVLVWPLIGILFWWGAGRGFEALFAARRQVVHPRITWIETVTGAVLFLFCAAASVGLSVCPGVDKDFPSKFLVAGMAVWAVLGGLVPLARIAQWRIRRLESGTVIAETSKA